MFLEFPAVRLLETVSGAVSLGDKADSRTESAKMDGVPSLDPFGDSEGRALRVLGFPKGGEGKLLDFRRCLPLEV